MTIAEIISTAAPMKQKECTKLCEKRRKYNAVLLDAELQIVDTYKLQFLVSNGARRMSDAV